MCQSLNLRSSKTDVRKSVTLSIYYDNDIDVGGMTGGTDCVEERSTGLEHRLDAEYLGYIEK